MKHYVKIIVILLVAIFLFGCKKGEEKSAHEKNEENKETEKTTEQLEDKEEDEPEQPAITDPITPDQFPEHFLDGNFEAIYNQTSEEFQQMVLLAQFERLSGDFSEGVESFELFHSFPTQSTMTEYQWLSSEGDKGIRAVFDEDLTIVGLQLMPISSYPEMDKTYTKNTYQMPAAGEWFVFWGGTNELVNYHYALEVQRYAYDLVMTKEHSSFEGDPTKNESYYAFGKEVLAPAKGVVVSVENEIPDNTPGVTTNAQEPLGNYVILEHEHEEYSVIAHLKQGSVEVQEGDEVEAGEVIGLVGNSGNSSEPHIHFQVSDSPEWEKATSIRIQLENGTEPIRGEVVQGFLAE